MTTISPELVERMVKLVRDMARHASNLTWIETAKEIAALLPAPVDPDLIEARLIAWRKFSYADHSKVSYVDGKNDDGPGVQSTLAGIKRGRELANDGWIVWRGGESPCPGKRVERISRNGEECGPCLADELRWKHGPAVGFPDYDIIAYRIVKRADGGV